jgi:hypothetical protein
MAAVTVGDGGTLHIQARRRDDEGRWIWRYVIEDAHHRILDDASDLRTGAGDPIDTRKAMETLVGYLGAAAESHRYTLQGQSSENSDMFPPQVMEWAYEHDDDLAALALNLEEPPPRQLRIVRRYFYFTDDDVTAGDISYRDETTDVFDCEPDHDDLADGDTAVTLAARVLIDQDCTQPSTSPGPLSLGDWWTHPDGSYLVDPDSGLRCEPSAHPEGFDTTELNAINDLL